MARNKAINVKVPTLKIITALEASLAKLEADYATQAVNEAKYDKAVEKWKAEVFEFAMANVKKSFTFALTIAHTTTHSTLTLT